MTMTSTDREKIDLLMLAIAERRMRGQLDLTAPLTPAAMERISIEIDCPISRQKIARVITRALQKVRHHPSISAIKKPCPPFPLGALGVLAVQTSHPNKP